MSVTLEDAELLHALVKLVKPRRALEIGTGLGVSAMFIAQAMKDNGSGMLISLEPNEDLRRQATDFLANVPCVVTSRIFTDPYDDLDLVFVDSGYEYRGGDIKEWLTNGYRGLVVVHDSNRDYDELAYGNGVFIPCSDGMWVGRGRW